MDNGINFIFPENSIYFIPGAYITMHKEIPVSSKPIFNIRETFRITGIGKLVEIYNISFKIRFIKDITYKIRSDKAGTTGHQNVFKFTHIKIFLFIFSLSTSI